MGSEVVIDRIFAEADEEWERRERKRRRARGGRGSRSISAKSPLLARKAREKWGTREDKGASRTRVCCAAASINKSSAARPGPSAGKKRLPQDDRVGEEAREFEIWFPPKRIGEIGELEFMQKAIRKGFLVSKPWGDSDRYDAVTDWKGRLKRVQVRATLHRMGARGFAVHASVYVGRKIVGLTKKDCDVLAAYIFTKDLWYIVPVEKFVPRKNLWFYPDGSKKGSKFEEFREAWDWLKGKKKRKRRSGRR